MEGTEVGREPALEVSSEGLGPRQQRHRPGRLPMMAGQADRQAGEGDGKTSWLQRQRLRGG